MIDKYLGPAGWLILAYIAFARLSPIALHHKSRTLIPSDFCVFGHRLHFWLGLFAYFGRHIILKVLQLVVPGRPGRSSDALVKVAGGITGIMFSALITRWLSRKQVA
jgi:hypothetical protein